MKIGIILTSDERSKAYIQKLENNNIKLDYYFLMNDNQEKKFSKNETEISLNKRSILFEYDHFTSCCGICEG